MKTLKIAADLSFPVDLTTQVEVIIAKRRAGKSYTMRRMTEQLLKNGQQVVMVDPKGDQWGLRSSADGRSPGFPVLILGGEHGDLPLEVHGGELVARLVVEERVSVLLDLSIFRKHEIATFMTDFLENLYRLKAKEIYRTPVKLVVDEADAIAPQKPQMNETRMLGAIEDIVRRGGQRGIGCTLVTQRSAVLNKNVLTQAQVLVVLRTIAPQDLAAIKAWIDVHGSVEEGKTLMDSLPSLPVGDAWFWSPGWPSEAGIFQRVHVLPIETFDSGATPKPGEKKVVPKNLADVDLEALKKQMSATIEKAKNENPVVLRKRIAELERNLHNAGKNVDSASKSTPSPEWLEKATKDVAVRKDREFALERKELERQIIVRDRKLAQIGKILDMEINPLPKMFVHTEMPRSIVMKPGDIIPMKTNIEPLEGLTNPEQRILNAIAWMESIRIPEPERPAVAFLAGYTNTRSTGFTNPCGALRSKGLISYPSGDTITLTELGREQAEFPDITPSAEALQQAVLAKLPGPEAKILSLLLEVYPEKIGNLELAARAGYTNDRSTGYTNPRGRLRSFGLIEYLPGGFVRARDILFLA